MLWNETISLKKKKEAKCVHKVVLPPTTWRIGLNTFSSSFVSTWICCLACVIYTHNIYDYGATVFKVNDTGCLFYGYHSGTLSCSAKLHHHSTGRFAFCTHFRVHGVPRCNKVDGFMRFRHVNVSNFRYK